MPIVMQLRGQADGMPTPWDGQFLKAFDFEAHDGVGEITMTADAGEAMHFADMAEMHRFYTTSPKCRPLRPDGLLNRPLTATNWDVYDPEERR